MVYRFMFVVYQGNCKENRHPVHDKSKATVPQKWQAKVSRTYYDRADTGDCCALTTQGRRPLSKVQNRRRRVLGRPVSLPARAKLHSPTHGSSCPATPNPGSSNASTARPAAFARAPDCTTGPSRASRAHATPAPHSPPSRPAQHPPGLLNSAQSTRSAPPVLTQHAAHQTRL